MKQKQVRVWNRVQKPKWDPPSRACESWGELEWYITVRSLFSTLYISTSLAITSCIYLWILWISPCLVIFPVFICIWSTYRLLDFLTLEHIWYSMEPPRVSFTVYTSSWAPSSVSAWLTKYFYRSYSVTFIFLDLHSSNLTSKLTVCLKHITSF